MRRIGLTCLCAALLSVLVGVARPRTATALSTGEAVGIGIGAWLGVVAIGVAIVHFRGDVPPATAHVFDGAPPRSNRDDRPVHVGLECRTDGGGLPVLCW
jgi:hypothetical protein